MLPRLVKCLALFLSLQTPTFPQVMLPQERDTKLPELQYTRINYEVRLVDDTSTDLYFPINKGTGLSGEYFTPDTCLLMSVTLMRQLYLGNQIMSASALTEHEELVNVSLSAIMPPERMAFMVEFNTMSRVSCQSIMRLKLTLKSGKTLTWGYLN